MKGAAYIATTWGMGLNATELAAIGHCTGPGMQLVEWPVDSLPGAEILEKEEPVLAWIPWRVWRTMPLERQTLYRENQGMQRALLLQDDRTRDDLEAILDEGFLAVLREPYTTVALQDTINRALESRHLFDDLYAMAEEIYLEREILERRNAHLSFINNFLARATESLEPTVILANARKDLEQLLPVDSLQGIFWPPCVGSDNQIIDAEVYLETEEYCITTESWLQLMFKTARKLTGRSIGGYHVTQLPVAGAACRNDAEISSTIMLPMRAGDVVFGCLALTPSKGHVFSKDQVELMRTALKHLGIALHNGLLYGKIKTQAETDGLTKVHNRLHFERRLQEEHGRHRRFRQSLSMFIVDLDHFKRINDTHGHLAGDMVLCKTGAVLLETLRNTDYVARYGGEEFAILLPDTPTSQAWKLAERIRRAIADMEITYEGTPITVTCSIGSATVEPDEVRSPKSLVAEADRQLYQAKQTGRNRVCHAPPQQHARLHA
ncbi:MAG: diguanylate cyclase [Desulfovibrionaceae bacterium]